MSVVSRAFVARPIGPYASSTAFGIYPIGVECEPGRTSRRDAAPAIAALSAGDVVAVKAHLPRVAERVAEEEDWRNAVVEHEHPDRPAAVPARATTPVTTGSTAAALAPVATGRSGPAGPAKAAGLARAAVATITTNAADAKLEVVVFDGRTAIEEVERDGRTARAAAATALAAGTARSPADAAAARPTGQRS